MNEVFRTGDRVVLIDDDGLKDDILCNHQVYTVTEVKQIGQHVLGENKTKVLKIRNLILLKEFTLFWIDRERFVSLKTYTINNRKKKIENLKLKIS